MQDFTFELYERNSSGNIRTAKYRGPWLIVDNGYLNWPTTVPPIKRTCSRHEIWFSPWLESIRKDVECTFGIFTHQWSILRSAIPMNVSVRKTVALVLCLAKLHNYCIDADNTVVLSSTASDEWQHEMNRAVLLMVATDHSDSKGGMTLCQLLGGWNHFDDVVGICGCYNQQR